MSGFKALNVESDDESDFEIDDTKELQIEDALKLYQNALKYHAEGPGSYDLAAEAYEQLFQSEIFKYPESQNELRRIELYGPVVETDDLWLDDVLPRTVVATGGLDSGPSTLPQILHLSHKNYAQFKLESLAARLDALQVSLSQLLDDAAVALDHFVEALDKDDTDLDLWLRTANIGEILGSRRLARFCLEAVLDGDDEALGSMLALPSMHEGVAGEKLRRLVLQLDDKLSVLQVPMFRGKRKAISQMLKQRLDSYDAINEQQKALKQHEVKEPYQPTRVMLNAPNTWAEVGELLLRQLMAEQHGTSSTRPAIAVAFDIQHGLPRHDALQPSSPPPLQIEYPQALAQQTILGSTVDEQFPGRDGGLPTAQPQIASADATMNAITGGDVSMTDRSSMALPSRKRPGDAAGLDETAEERRTKRGRTRIRESNVEDSRQAMIDANTQWEFEQQINEIQAADDWMFETVGNLFERIGVVGFEAGREVRQELQSPGTEHRPSTNGAHHDAEGLKLAKSDIQAFLSNYVDETANAFLQGGDNMDIGQGSNLPGAKGTAAKGSRSKTSLELTTLTSAGLYEFVRSINHGWLLTSEVAWRWIQSLLRPSNAGTASTYRGHLWPEDLKTMVVRTLVNFDESFLEEAIQELDQWKHSNDRTDDRLVEALQAIFELHLDIYCLIKEPNSGVDAPTVMAQRDRLQRWSNLAREAIQLRSLEGDADLSDELSVRFLWATTFHLGAASDVSQDHAIECMNDLKTILLGLNEPCIQLQNNAIMPEISVPALEREISHLTTRDFFLKVTNQEQKDPVSTIESLEPLLTSLERTACQISGNGIDSDDMDPSTPSDLVRFLQTSDISVRMLLWQQLRDAYLAIDYKPMVVLCYFSMIRLLLSELKSTATSTMAQEERRSYVLKTWKFISNMTAKIWAIAAKSQDAFDCVDEHNLRSAVTMFGEVLQLLQVFNVAGDSIRVGQSRPPRVSNSIQAPTWPRLTTGMQELQVHTWLILYHLLKEAIFQFHDLFPKPAEDMFDFLRVVHRNLGLRTMCGSMNKVFVRTLKDEFQHMTHVEGYDSEQAQVLYDLYGLNCFLNPSYELIEHQCPHDAFIEKSVALQAVDLLLQQAAKLPTKDLVKHPLKDTIEKVHGAAPRKKPTEAILTNRDIYRSFLRSPINPLDLFMCLKGEGTYLTVVYVPREDALLASKGWYFLMGHIALAKFRSQKRTAQAPTEDVDIAIAFFMQDLEYSMDKWETWFRLAQAYDTKIEESVVWSAEKLNNSMPEIVQLQRAAIHCYTMATALAYRSAEPDEDTMEKMTEMFIEFGTRLYASSREPFKMRPFEFESDDKFLSLPDRPGVSKSTPFRPLRKYTAWKLARVLYRRALKQRPQSWMLHYMLGKCLWKMHCTHPDLRTPRDVPPSVQEVLAILVKTIELIPDDKKKDSREKREPILEPHYKLVSIVHKLVTKRELGLPEAQEALNHTPYARNMEFPKEMDDWVPHILAVLTRLRAADKSNWHHRMVARAAHIIYDGSEIGALGAKHELTQQMFTKTMIHQVWRPEAERAGRHFVYTSQYTRFFVTILEQLRDRASLELLARRVRRRGQEYFDHAGVWQDICLAWLRLLRAHAQVEEGAETATFSNIAHEDFLARKEPLEKWMQATEPGVSSALDALREVQELKKINQSMMKPGPIDDLIGDAYAQLFKHPGKQLYDEEQRIKREEEANRPVPHVSPPRNPMMSLTHLMNVDGANEAPAPPAPGPANPTGQPTPVEPAPARKKIGVGRREIRTCAEAAFQKTAPASLVSNTKIPATWPRVEVVIDTDAHHMANASAETSAPGSIHDSADDESELSELEEEIAEDEDAEVLVKEEAKPRLMFPGLSSAVESREVSEGFATAEEEGGDIDIAAERSSPLPIEQAGEFKGSAGVGDGVGAVADREGERMEE